MGNPILPTNMWTFYFLASALFCINQAALLKIHKRPALKDSGEKKEFIEEVLGNVLVIRTLITEQDQQIEHLKDEVQTLQSSLADVTVEKLCSFYINKTYGLMEDIDVIRDEAKTNLTKLQTRNTMLQKAVLSSKDVITFNTVNLAETKEKLKNAELRIDSKDKLIIEAIKELEKLRKKENHTMLVVDENILLSKRNEEKDQQIKELKKELTKYRMFKTFFVRIVDELKTMNNSEVNIADFMKRIKRGANMPIDSLGSGDTRSDEVLLATEVSGGERG